MAGEARAGVRRAVTVGVGRVEWAAAVEGELTAAAALEGTAVMGKVAMEEDGTAEVQAPRWEGVATAEERELAAAGTQAGAAEGKVATRQAEAGSD